MGGARARQLAREAEEDALLAAEERQLRLQAREQREGAEHARLQVAFERFQLSEVGRTAKAFRESLPVHTLAEPLAAALASGR